MTITEIQKHLQAAQKRLLELEGNSEVRDNLLRAEVAILDFKEETQAYLRASLELIEEKYISKRFDDMEIK